MRKYKVTFSLDFGKVKTGVIRCSIPAKNEAEAKAKLTDFVASKIQVHSINDAIEDDPNYAKVFEMFAEIFDMKKPPTS